MYILLSIALAVAAVALAWLFTLWLLPEAPEDDLGGSEGTRRPRDFYDVRTWVAYQRWTRQKPALLAYRRDKRGRFRKMS